MHEPIDGILGGHKRTRDTGCASAAIGLQHIAIQMDGALTQFFQIKHGAHGTANEALNFLCAATLFTACCFAVTACVCGARQHAVFSRHPTFTTALFVSWHFFFNRSRAQHACVAKFDQDRAFGMDGKASRYLHFAKLILFSVVSSLK